MPLVNEDFYASPAYIADAITRLCARFLNELAAPPEKISPFLLHLLYQVLLIQRESYRTTASEKSLEAVELVKGALGSLDTRWRAAGESIPDTVECGSNSKTGAYVEISEAREAIYH